MAAAAAAVDVKPEVCRDFLRHACARGSRCRFRHESAGGGGGSTDQSTSGGRGDGCGRCREQSVDNVDRRSTTANDLDDVAQHEDDDDVIVQINTSHASTYNCAISIRIFRYVR